MTLTEALLEFTTDGNDQRLDRFIVSRVPQLSRAHAQKLIEDGFVRVDGIPRKASYRLRVGELVTVHIPPPEPTDLRAENIPLDIVYEDADVIVVNKPAGLVVHPAAGHAGGTLLNALLARVPDLAANFEEDEDIAVGGVARPGIVHRLDKDTSGLIVVAKNDAAMRDLQAQFKARTVLKVYLALVEGQVAHARGKIDAPIARDPRHRKKMMVVSRGGREAVTIFHVRDKFERYTLLDAEPKTGRTHQIRVHLAFIGHPVVGDETYGHRSDLIARQFLHAWNLAFDLPRTHARVEFTAPRPRDLREALVGLGSRFEV